MISSADLPSGLASASMVTQRVPVRQNAGGPVFAYCRTSRKASITSGGKMPELVGR
jgi:protein tyrosine phosphatase (PTP) superfamily phosphohydrolase (DUF442 family)